MRIQRAPTGLNRSMLAGARSRAPVSDNPEQIQHHQDPGQQADDHDGDTTRPLPEPHAYLGALRLPVVPLAGHGNSFRCDPGVRHRQARSQAPALPWVALPIRFLPMAVQWFRILEAALARCDAIAVADAVEQHLGRPPTRSELMAARRASRRFAAGSDAQVAILPAVVDTGTRRILVIARPGVDLDDFASLRRVVAASRQPDKPQGRLTKNTSMHVESMLTKVSQAARSARLIPVEQIEPAHAKLLAEDLIESVSDLTTLATDLIRRSRQNVTTQREASNQE